MDHPKRILKEINDIKEDPEAHIRIKFTEDLNQFYASIEGPPDTPYEGGVFLVDINLVKEFPFKPPKMRFITKVYHPNVSSQTGAICLDILKDAWSPALSIRTALLSLQSLLSSPVPDDPQDAQVASHYKMNYEGFKQTAMEWTKQYAKTNLADYDDI
ncbi:ubiquitin conjugating enzyme 1 [Absidia repens]|uniref:Ubiquitin-conjugating enzyme E2 1 n=1 Tax=Absidia repens TaxID=90262 RepID=A0A1X2J0B0_9FUNG|nr:ubiquitin conjugating enzyme 1 [Absidia repens]